MLNKPNSLTKTLKIKYLSTSSFNTMKVLSLFILTIMHRADAASSSIRGASLERELLVDNTTVVSNPCDAVRCNSTNPICIVKYDGTAACVKDTCLDTVCTANSTCHVGSNGSAICVPLVISPVVPICKLACIQGYTCVNGQCVPSPTQAPTPICKFKCIQGYTCVNGQCVPQTTQPPTRLCDVLCIQGYICVNGQCVPKTTQPPTPFCKFACIQGYTCVNGQCVPSPTQAPTPICKFKCIQGYTCVNGQCVPQTTQPPGPFCKFACIQGYICVNGQCVPKTTQPPTPLCKFACIQGYTCVNGQCVPIPTQPPTPLCKFACIQGYTCVNGQCVPIPTQPPGPFCKFACIQGYTCVNGQCVPITIQPRAAADPCLVPGVCPANTSCSVDSSNGKAVCVPIVCDKIRGCSTPEAVLWWDLVKANYVGNDLARCEKRHNLAPIDGTTCDEEAKTCFFGNKECPVVGPYPTTRCRCAGGADNKWKCDRDLTCPVRMNDKIY